VSHTENRNDVDYNIYEEYKVDGILLIEPENITVDTREHNS